MCIYSVVVSWTFHPLVPGLTCTPIRISEPFNRGTTKGTQRAFGFPDEQTGTPTAERFTSTQRYEVIDREDLATVVAGRIPEQASRGGLGCSTGVHCLRFSDHQGINPNTVVVAGSRLTALFDEVEDDRG